MLAPRAAKPFRRRALLQVLGLANVQVEKPVEVAMALSWYQGGMDFDDSLHLALATDIDQFLTVAH